jgi:hypothetical protein
VLVAAPLLSGLIVDLLEARGYRRLLELRHQRLTPRTLGINTAVLTLAVALTVIRIWGVVRRQGETEARNFPEAATSFLYRTRPPGPIMNHYNWGGYFIWKLFPEYRVFIDGRADLYGDAFMSDFANSYYLRDDWSKSLSSFNIQTIVLPPDAPLITALRSQSGWGEIYADTQAVVLTHVRSPK